MNPIVSLRARFIFLISLLVFSTAQAAEPAIDPITVVKEASNQVRDALKAYDNKLDFIRSAELVKNIMEPHVDVNRASLLILGKHWRTATHDQRDRFKREFRTLMIRTYTTAFSEFHTYHVDYLPLETTPGENKVTVRTEMRRPSSPQPLPVSYRMENIAGEWKVYDVIISGVSLVQNYRSTFSSEVARTGSLDSVIDDLAQRNATALGTPTTAAAPSKS
jgi:phospholipid transport system substrate-binding protein